jgi:regulation of enolase protein 1 (concanavalin A-like superfamily)
LGIYGSLPLETLHAWLLALIEYLLQLVYSHVEVDDDVSDWCDRRYSGDTTSDIKSRRPPKNATMKVDQAEFERRLKMVK